MTYGVWLPLLTPLLAVPAARRLAWALPARAAAWLLTGLAVLLGLSSTAALALVVFAGALRLPAVAALGHVSVPLLRGDTQVLVPAAVAAAVLLVVCAAAATHRVRAQCRELRVARAAADAGGSAGAGELAVRREDLPYAFALPGRTGRIVVTTGMLRALTPGERAALLAHERAHLTGRHHLFLAAGAVAAVLHPALRWLREPLAYALERWADESAARVTGDRRLVARAVGRAALAAHAAASVRRPSVLPGATAGPVPRRVAALLHPEPHGATCAGAWRVVASMLLVCAALSAASANAEAAHDLHANVEIAQGETTS